MSSRLPVYGWSGCMVFCGNWLAARAISTTQLLEVINLVESLEYFFFGKVSQAGWKPVRAGSRFLDVEQKSGKGLPCVVLLKCELTFSEKPLSSVCLRFSPSICRVS